jgi:hypothetical protein
VVVAALDHTREEQEMNLRRMIVAGLIAAVAVSAAASAATGPARQRVAITVKPGVVNTMVLNPLTQGELKRDSGTVTWQQESGRVVVRGGQRVEYWVGTGAFVLKQGRMLIRFNIGWLDAGRSHQAGTGTWKVVGGTGRYAKLTGGGRSAHVWLPRGPVAGRAEGFMHLG